MASNENPITAGDACISDFVEHKWAVAVFGHRFVSKIQALFLLQVDRKSLHWYLLRMPVLTPEYRVDHLKCPLNPGKLKGVRTLVHTLRAAAKREAYVQWRFFHKHRHIKFEPLGEKGRPRPWVTDKTLMAAHGQMVTSQVAGALQGFIRNVQNTYRSRVTHSSLPSHIRHQLHAINRRSGWFVPGNIDVRQTVYTVCAKTGERRERTENVVISFEIRALARSIWRQALQHHRKPNFRNWNPWIDQRGVFLQKNRTAKRELWLDLGLHARKRVAIPVEAHPGLVRRQEAALYANALAQAGECENRVFAGLAEALGKTTHPLILVPIPSLNPSLAGNGGTEGKVVVEKPEDTPEQALAALQKGLSDPQERNPYPAPYALARTIQLMLSDDEKSLKIGVCTDMSHVFQQSKTAYTPKCDAIALDLGLCTLFGTSDGDLLGRDWKTRLEGFDSLLKGIALHRQRLGLKVASERYRYHVQRLRGFIKTEVNRVLNRLVARRKPARLILEDLDFQDARMSRRLNRLIRNFGQGVIRTKLRDLELQFGITSEFREAAYTSKECHSCGYVDKRNRPGQAKFQCKFCGKKSHADVGAARVVRDRRSIPASFLGFRHRLRTTLLHRTRAFEERFPRPFGGPADPRWSNPYFAAWAKRMRSCDPEVGISSSSACGIIHA